MEERSGLVRLAGGPDEVKTVPAWEFYQEEGEMGVQVGLAPARLAMGMVLLWAALHSLPLCFLLL